MNWIDREKKGHKILKDWKLVFQSLPIAAATGASLLPLQRLGHQFVMLIVLIWIQVYLIVECFLMIK